MPRVLFTCLLLLPSALPAHAGTSWAWSVMIGQGHEPAAAAPVNSPGSSPGAVAEPQVHLDAWLQALNDRPPIVSLGPPPDLSGTKERLPELLKERLLLLGRKRFSNRQWRVYWEHQERLAGEAATALGRSPHESDHAKRETALTWAALAKEKVANQDAYLEAIGTEQDVLEERLEAALDREHEGKEPPAPPAVHPNPYQERESRIASIRGRLEFQSERYAEAQQELRVIQQQVQSMQQLDVAQKRDVALAKREVAIAREQAESADATWAAAWRVIRNSSAAKLSELQRELELGEQRRRGLEVEVELSTTQVAYRQDKVKELQVALEQAQSFDTWAAATWATAEQFVRDRLWKVLLSLLVITLLAVGALWGIERGKRAFLRMVDDGDDKTSAQEQRAKTMAEVFVPVARVGVVVVAALMALNHIGVDTGPIVGSVAILGLAVSFGSQNLVRDVVNGFFILAENQYGVGDVVEINGKGGVVETVNVRSTRMRGLDGTLYIIPNGEITNVANRTRSWARVVLEVKVAYDSNIEKLESVVNDVGREIYRDPNFASKFLEPPTFDGLTNLSDSAVVFRVLAKTQPGAQWAMHRELNRRLLAALRAADIEIPFPQTVVWHRQEEHALRARRESSEVHAFSE